MPTTLQDLVTRQEVEEVVVRMFVATDERDWSTLKTCFSAPFVLDMTSMVGGSPAIMTPEEVANAWAEGFKPLDHVHHQIGNLRTRATASTATVSCYGVALHHRSRITAELKTRRFVGTYELTLKKQSEIWRIAHLTFLLKFIDGNLSLETAP